MFYKEKYRMGKLVEDRKWRLLDDVAELPGRNWNSLTLERVERSVWAGFHITAYLRALLNIKNLLQILAKVIDYDIILIHMAQLRQYHYSILPIIPLPCLVTIHGFIIKINTSGCAANK